MSGNRPRGSRYRLADARERFNDWRTGRPFPAGILTASGAISILYPPYAGLTIGQLPIRMATTAGCGSLIIGGLLVILSLTMWLQPVMHVFAGSGAILLALASIPVCNLGGFFLGLLLSLLGASLSIAWTPCQDGGGPQDRRQDAAEGRHRNRQTSAQPFAGSGPGHNDRRTQAPPS
ncbi:DUF6114 domain-containing protein [Streptomyces fuscichromogenes]|uniref:DUF6114 domain-containing protein n=1 Tax=Streptomyces fuscichromogenes TaxID=1324013 RepID=UPI00167083D7|nr:DUF6114 domain-containing protein [Streptomyces fuscichromogenes]